MLEYLIVFFFSIHCIVSIIRRLAKKSHNWLKYSMEKWLNFGAIDIII